MKLLVTITALFFSLGVQAIKIDDFKKRSDEASVELIIVIEHLKNSKPGDFFAVGKAIKNSVDEMFEELQKSTDDKGFIDAFLWIHQVFNIEEEKYVRYALLSVHIKPSILLNMPDKEIEGFKKFINNKLFDLYQEAKLDSQKIAPDCFISCVQVGVEKLESE